MGEFRMPSLGADMEQGVLVEWLVKVGDPVRRGDIVAVVETPKSTVEVECFETGTIRELLVEEGQTVPVGAPLAVLGEGAADRVPAGAPAGPGVGEPTIVAGPKTVPKARPRTRPRTGARPKAAVGPAPVAKPTRATGVGPALSPVLRHLARQLGVDPTTLRGTGPDGALTRHDVEQAGAAAAAATRAAPAPPSVAPTVTAPIAPTVTAQTAPSAPPRALRPRISPLARRLAAETGVDLSRLTGTGVDGAIRADDVRRARDRMTAPEEQPPEPGPAAPVAAAEPAGAAPARSAAERAADMRRSIAALMTVSNREIPHYHLTLTVDLHRGLLWMRDRNRELDMSERLVPAALLLAAAARAARVVPELNGHWVDGAFRPADDVDLGLILSLRSGGLLVPVIAGADRRSVEETMASIKELTRRARTGRLRGSDLMPPTITVSNLGDQGVDSVLGVIYPPQVALVGFGAVADRPWAVDGMLGVRPLVTVSLAGDHRATDGATGSRFLKTIDRLLQSPEEL
jgi:pyruvate dehydrogenase E2 component (dihydrolipoamide acetyltransferase)